MFYLSLLFVLIFLIVDIIWWYEKFILLYYVYTFHLISIIRFAIIIYFFLYNNGAYLIYNSEIFCYFLESNLDGHLYMSSGGRENGSTVNSSGSGTGGSGPTTGGPPPGGRSNFIFAPYNSNPSPGQSGGGSNPQGSGSQQHNYANWWTHGGHIDSPVNMIKRNHLADNLESIDRNPEGIGYITLEQAGVSDADQKLTARVIQRNPDSVEYQQLKPASNPNKRNIPCTDNLIRMLRTPKK